MKKTAYIVATVQLFISASACADSKILEKLDLDKDGQITITEAVAIPAVLASFGKIDTDGNGKISSIELAKSKVTLTNETHSNKSK
jgi:Ca2+-binding EF-hand superfamily protein